MSKAAIIAALAGSSELNDLGIDEDRIWSNFGMDVAPATGMWVILRWGVRGARFGSQRGGKRNLTAWVYALRRETTDYGDIDKAIEVINDTLVPLEQVEGSDGWTLTSVDYVSESEDLADAGYDAIARSVTMTVVSRLT